MKLPRNLSSGELVFILDKYGYRTTHQTGSHLRLTTDFKKVKHHITIPVTNSIRIGTLNSILNEIAAYLDIDKKILIQELFQS